MTDNPSASFTHRGHRLSYEVLGRGDRVVVYMHGLLLDAEVNRSLASALAAGGNRVVVFDLLGHGRSDQPRHASAYRIDSYAEQVVALLDHLGVEQVVLGGVSLGANVSLVTASTHPDRVRALVLEMPVMEWAVPSAALTLVVAHAHDLIHPIDDAANLAAQLPDSRLVRARTPFELRLRPARLTGEIRTFLDEVFQEQGEAALSGSG